MDTKLTRAALIRDLERYRDSVSMVEAQRLIKRMTDTMMDLDPSLDQDSALSKIIRLTHQDPNELSQLIEV